ncbi:MAG: hypothetical protein BWK78_01495 [Thiotrichaceae bacterium IS1]|nr:MAG: hypothetical protein BWK78_01495 [Thiotrichaceae bacterium IS1]
MPLVGVLVTVGVGSLLVNQSMSQIAMLMMIVGILIACLMVSALVTKQMRGWMINQIQYYIR